MITRLTDEEFYSIYSKVPRAVVDVIIKSDEGILLSLRAIEPSKDLWHLPGGTVYKGETLTDAVRRVVKKETNLEVGTPICLGYMEFLDEVRSGISIHTVSIVMKVAFCGGEFQHDPDAYELRWWKEQPSNIIKEHADFLHKHHFLQYVISE